MALGFKKKGLFGASAPDMTTTTQPMAGMGQGIQEQPKSGGFFGEGGAGRAIAGTVGDYLLQQSGMSPLYAPAMAQQQQAALQSAAEQRKRSLDMADWKAKHDYEVANPKEQGPTAMQRNL
ncbi:hypothetical protein [Croceicoccus sp. Ery15]|uniref:hypothetical protein n=1 Tax=Croceicoccus sp. Ery15 TaxID=1703338 RepID=UPI001E42287E|nr:hypothetical protein [Croceicoccus sp. Ery15]